VLRLTPFHVITEVGTKPVPVTVSSEPPSSVVTVDGEIPESCGAGLLTVKLVAEDVPPPGVGFTTVTCAVPPVAKSAAVIEAWSWVELTKVVLRALWFHWTMDP
jgi:hypothetical protein